MLFSKRHRKVIACVIGAFLYASSTLAATHASAPAAASASMQADPVASVLSATTLAPGYSGDDPEHVRDALSGHVTSAAPAPSITNRVRSFLAHPLRPFHKGEQTGASATQTAARANGASQSDADTRVNRTFIFVLPASYGVRYDSHRKMLSVNVSLASPEQPDAILLKQIVKGQSGRKLVIAPEAKAKGFVQTFDTILLQTGDSTKTNVQGRVLVNNLEHARNGDFAIVLICTLVPPYMTEQVDHNDPTDEEPTDITRKTSALQGIVNSVWLVDRKDGTIITKRLRLVK